MPEQIREYHVGLRDEFINKPSPRMMGVGRELFAQRKDGNATYSETGNNVPIIFTTASIADKQKDELLAGGADGLLCKPFRESEIADILQEKSCVELIFEQKGEKEDDFLDESENVTVNIDRLADDIRSKLYQATVNGNIIGLRNMITAFKIQNRLLRKKCVS
ncbi:MAG: hypothetical protein OEM38_08155 [Gammaproteobacteria bacterium]|nr:hypothetical protein [Gammaproteobacteria bacterium]